MNSGSAVPTDPVDSAKAQQVYDAVVQGVGCAGQADTLQCLREAEYQVSKPVAHVQRRCLGYNPRYRFHGVTDTESL